MLNAAGGCWIFLTGVSATCPESRPEWAAGPGLGQCAGVPCPCPPPFQVSLRLQVLLGITLAGAEESGTVARGQ